MAGKKPIIRCPYCHIFAQMDNQEFHFSQDVESPNGIPQIKSRMEIRRCSHCGGKFFYENGELKYPEPETFVPEQDMPTDVQSLFVEAANICHRSPRAACALLRLAIEVLCNHLNATGKNIDDKIASLVKRGLSQDVQQALDFVRVVGNNAVHPGQIVFDVDNITTASMLFSLLNIIVKRLISEPATIKALYEGLPDSAKDHVAQRDGK